MTETNDIRIMYLALKFIPGIGARRGYSLVSHFGSVKNVFQQDVSSIKEICKVKTANFEKQFNRKIIFDRAEKELEQIIKKGYGITTLEDEHYPSNLKNIPDPPIVLYYKGNIIIDDINSVSIVGTRNPTQEGKNLAYELAYDLSSTGITIISGLAKGIDSLAHRGCVDNNKRTVAVLGSGIDVIYPYKNKSLAEKIVLNNGLIFSEFPLGTKPERYNFPQRNRIIAGLSLGVAIVQSPEDSGALITARIANDYGRTVFAFPGKPGNSMYKGSNQLLKNGAFLIENANDVIEQLKFELSVDKKEIRNIIDKKEEKIKIKKDFMLSQERNIQKSTNNKFDNLKENKNITINKNINFDNLNDNEKKILPFLSVEEKKHIDQVCIESGFNIKLTSEILTSLLLKGIIEENKGKYYTLKTENEWSKE